MKKYITVILALMLSYGAWASDGNYKCVIRNQKQLSKNQMVFDIYLECENKQGFRFQAIQSGIDFNYQAVSNGGKLTASIVAGSSQDGMLNIRANNVGIRIDQESGQLRIAAYLMSKKAYQSGAFKIRLGTFRITNTVPFTSNSKPSLTWSSARSGRSTTANAVLVSNTKTGKSANITNLDNHFVDNPDFRLNTSAANSIMAYNDAGVIHFHIPSLTAHETHIRLYDTNGKQVAQQKLMADGQFFQISRDGLVNGIYIAKVLNNANEYTIKLQFD